MPNVHMPEVGHAPEVVHNPDVVHIPEVLHITEVGHPQYPHVLLVGEGGFSSYSLR